VRRSRVDPEGDIKSGRRLVGHEAGDVPSLPRRRFGLGQDWGHVGYEPGFELSYQPEQLNTPVGLDRGVVDPAVHQRPRRRLAFKRSVPEGRSRQSTRPEDTAGDLPRRRPETFSTQSAVLTGT
jgi:hypothetical protein